MTGLLLALLALGQAAGEPARPGREAGPGSAPAAAPGPAFAPDSIGGLLSESAPESTAAPVTARGMFFRMLGWVAALAVLALAAVRITKRLMPGRVAVPGAGALRVVGRTALTPRHSIYAVRVGSQRLLLVGVSGDRIAPLSQFDDPAQVLDIDSDFGRTLEREMGEGGPRAETPGREEAGGSQREQGGLLAYQREVRRLREIVRGWRGRLRRPAGAEVERS